MVSSPVRRGRAIWTTATVRGAPRRATEPATRIALEETNRSQLQAANYLAQQQVASNTAANANIRYQEQSPGKSRVIRQAPDKAPNRHARTAKALNTPPSDANPLSAMNPTAASHSRTPQSERLTMCVSTDSINRMTSNHRQGGSHLSRKVNPSRESSSLRLITSRARTDERKTMIHASTPRSTATAAYRSTALPSP